MPDQTPQIALHIGVHKTATTHLQKSLMAVRPALLKAGVQYYGPAHFRNGRVSLVDRFGLGATPATRDATIEIADLARNRDKVVFSEENFIGGMYAGKAKVEMPLYPKAAERVARLAGMIAPDGLDVFVSVRNPATYLTSVFCQILLGGRYPNVETFKARNPVADVDWTEFIARLRAAPGVGRLIVWRQEDYASVFNQIKQLMLGDAAPLVSPDPKRVHQGLSADAVLDVQIRHAAGERGTLVQDARAAYPKGPAHPGFDLFLPEQHAAAQVRYDHQIAQIADMQGVTLLQP